MSDVSISEGVAMSRLVIENATIVDGTGAVPRPNETVIIDDGMITAVGRSLEIGSGPVQRIDAGGKVVMPGMIDCHCHISFGEARTQEEQDLYTSVESRTLRSAFNLKKVLRAGVTGFSAPGGSYYIGVALSNAVANGMVKGPRLTSAGRFITTSNGISDFYPMSVGVPEGSIGIVTNTIDEMRTEVRYQVKNGVDLIKIGDSAAGDFSAFRKEEIAAIAQMAHQLGKPVTIHARGSDAVDFAISAGVDWIMHGDRMTDEVIERLAESGIPLCPTLTLIANLYDWGHLVGVPERKRDAYKRLLFDYAAPALAKAHAAGVPFMTGTDSGFAVTPFGEWHARELELLMTYAGHSALEAIRAATLNGAVALGLKGQVGVIAPGMIADVLVVDGDPTKDIKVLQDRSKLTVIANGVVQTFDDDDVTQRWSYERAQTIALNELTQELVHGR
ncbi:MAG: amidohydrolase family protein [Actinobacteria bacterium]|nr:amidohydrolase family protein [Actinomycetota bacterium]